MPARKFHHAQFEVIAQVISEQEFRNVDYQDAITKLANELADAFERGNPNFNRTRFINAAKVVDQRTPNLTRA